MPLLGDVVRALFANCQSAAEIKAAAAWGGQLDRVFQQQQLDLLEVRFWYSCDNISVSRRLENKRASTSRREGIARASLMPWPRAI